MLTYFISTLNVAYTYLICALHIRQSLERLWHRYVSHDGRVDQSQTSDINTAFPVTPQSQLATPMSSFVNMDDDINEDDYEKSAPASDKLQQRESQSSVSRNIHRQVADDDVDVDGTSLIESRR